MRTAYKLAWALLAWPVIIILAVMGAWALVGVSCLCLAMVVADVPDRVGEALGVES